MYVLSVRWQGEGVGCYDANPEGKREEGGGVLLVLFLVCKLYKLFIRFYSRLIIIIFLMIYLLISVGYWTSLTQKKQSFYCKVAETDNS